jgi:hypothetical protein
MIWHSTRDPNGNLRYNQEHTKPELHEQGALPKSQQFADTGKTLGVASRGFHFTGRSTASDNHDANGNLHSDRSLLYDDRQNNESFIDSRNGTRANPDFKTPFGGVVTLGPVAGGVEFTPSSAEPVAQGQPGTTGPDWWSRIKSNFRSSTVTQSTNLPTKPAEKFQIGLRSSNVKVAKQDQKPTKESGLMTNTGVIGSVTR